MEGLRRKVGWKWSQRLSLKGMEPGVARGFLHLGRDLGAPKGAEWVSEKDIPESRWGLGGQ